ncbi:hypothetical protein ACFQZ4_40110 [Catellatospora coxensis]
MTSFPAAARRVRTADLDLLRRMHMLRECVLRFAPYGFRATWHHLLVSADMPRRLPDDPNSLVRAVDELSEARALWTAEQSAYSARRLAEKAAGRRTVRKADTWHTWSQVRLAHCPDPERHPTDRLPVVVARLIAAYRSGEDWSQTCPLCGSRFEQRLCRRCGIEPCGPPTFPVRRSEVEASYGWREIWRRTSVGGPGGGIVDFAPGRPAALRSGRRLVTEVSTSTPGRRAFVDITPDLTEQDESFIGRGWTVKSRYRSFRITHREYDEQLLSTDDRDVGAVLVRETAAADETALVAVLADWDLRPGWFDHASNTADPR